MPSSPQTVTTRGVFDYLYNSAGKAIVGATVNCTLNFNGASVTSPIVNVGELQQSTTTDQNGFWRFLLVPNDTITPTGTLYTIQSGNIASYDISVPSGGADVQSSSILANTPQVLSPATTGLTGPVTVTGALNVTGTSSLAALTATGALTGSGGGTLSGGFRISTLTLEELRFADQFSGATVSAKVATAAADPGNQAALVVIPPTSSGMIAPPAPTVTVNGATGATTYMYFVIAINANSDVVVSPTTTITNGNATLTASNFNAVSWNSVAGATSYKLVRLVIGGTEGVVVTQAGTSFNDQGGAVTTFTYPSTNLTTLAETLSVLDLRYLPTNQAAGIKMPVSDILNGSQTSTFKINRAFAGGADNGSTVAVSTFLTGGSGSFAGPDGEVASLYVENTRRVGSSRGMWGMNINLASDVNPAATMLSVGLEIDVNNNGTADATQSQPFDGLSVLAAGAHAARYGVLVGNSGGQLWSQGIHVGSVYNNTGIRIDALGAGATLGLDVAAPAQIGGHITWAYTPAPTLGALQTGVSSQSISGNDTRGNVTVTTTGSPPGAGANFALVTFGTAYGSTPQPIPGGWTNFGNLTAPGINGPGTTGFTFVATSQALPASTTLVAGFFVPG